MSRDEGKQGFPKAVNFLHCWKFWQQVLGRPRDAKQNSDFSSQHLTFNSNFWPLYNVTVQADVIYPCGCLFCTYFLQKRKLPFLVQCVCFPPDEEAVAPSWPERAEALGAVEGPVFLQSSRHWLLCLLELLIADSPRGQWCLKLLWLLARVTREPVFPELGTRLIGGIARSTTALLETLRIQQGGFHVWETLPRRVLLWSAPVGLSYTGPSPCSC